MWKDGWLDVMRLCGWAVWSYTAAISQGFNNWPFHPSASPLRSSSCRHDPPPRFLMKQPAVKPCLHCCILLSGEDFTLFSLNLNMLKHEVSQWVCRRKLSFFFFFLHKLIGLNVALLARLRDRLLETVLASELQILNLHGRKSSSELKKFGVNKDCVDSVGALPISSCLFVVDVCIHSSCMFTVCVSYMMLYHNLCVVILGSCEKKQLQRKRWCLSVKIAWSVIHQSLQTHQWNTNGCFSISARVC